MGVVEPISFSVWITIDICAAGDHRALSIEHIYGVEHGLHIRLSIPLMVAVLREWQVRRFSESRLVVIASYILSNHLITINRRISRHTVVERFNFLLRLLNVNVGQVGLAHLHRLLRSFDTAAPVRISVVVIKATHGFDLLPGQITISNKAHDAKANAEED